MELLNSSNSSSNNTAKTCLDYINYLNKDLHPFQTLNLLVPTDDRIWTERSETWLILFKVMIALLALLYLTVGIVSAVLLARKDCLRLTTRTFFAVYLSMAILGFSRAALFALDPLGILGYIGDLFPAWIILSRFLATGGFPSLVAACTLIVLTLVKLVKAKPGKQWYESWCYVLALLAIPYAIALVAEALGHAGTYPAILSGLLCETLFVFWGLFICIAYLAAGTRLLNTLNKCHRKATMVSEKSQPSHRSNNTSADQFKMHDKRTKRIARKIIVITFGTAAAGVFYSVVSAGAVVMVLLLNFKDCMGFENRTNAAAWLGVQFANFVTELLFAALILYSITDISLLLSFLKFLLTCRPCRSCGSVVEKEIEQGSPETLISNVPPEEGRIQEDGVTTQIERCPCEIGTANEVDDQQRSWFTLKIKKTSDSSMESVEEQSTLRQHRGRKMISRSHDTITSPEILNEDRLGQPLDMDTVSKVLSVRDGSTHFHSLWPSKGKLKRSRGSDPTMTRPQPPALPLRHCQTHIPHRHHMSPLVATQSLLTPVTPQSPLTHHPKSYQRQRTT